MPQTLHQSHQTTPSLRTRGQLRTCPTKPTESAANAATCKAPSAGKTHTTAASVQPKPLYLIDGLSMLDARLGSPAWFWPVVLGLVLGVLPLLASYVENV